MKNIIFHHNDLDGRCSAAAILIECDPLSECYELNHTGNAFPIEVISPDSTVWIVDYSVNPSVMDQIRKITKNIIWIDHHKSAIDKYNEYPYEIGGIRDISKAGCVLTWEYVLQSNNIPKFATLIGDFDIFAFKHPETKSFIAGMLAQNTTPNNIIWKTLYYDDERKEKPLLKDICKHGNIIEEYQKVRNREILEEWGYESSIDGHRCIVLNDGKGSQLFGDMFERYPIVACYRFNGERYGVSLYSKFVNVMKICKKRGGGGHPNAAGFSCVKRPFKKIRSIDWEI